MRDLGLLECLKNKNVLRPKELTKKLELSKYSIQVLLETSLSADRINFIKQKIH